MPVTDIGTGATVAFLTSSFSANIMSIDGPGIERPAIDTTHLGTTTARTHMPGDLYDVGPFDLEIQFDPNLNPPISSAAETIRITWPLAAGQSVAAKWEFSGFITAYKGGAKLEELMTGSMTIKGSGAITMTDAT